MNKIKFLNFLSDVTNQIILLDVPENIIPHRDNETSRWSRILIIKLEINLLTTVLLPNTNLIKVDAKSCYGIVGQLQWC